MEIVEVEEIVEESLSFTCLPDHIWEKTFSYSLNLGNLMMTCKYFNDLILKSDKLMSEMTLVLDASKSSDREKVAAILKSERKISRFYVKDMDLFNYNLFKILDQFKYNIREINFDRIHLSPAVLVDLFEMLMDLEELNLYSIIFNDNQPVSVGFKEGRKLKKVYIGTNDAKILHTLKNRLCKMTK